MFSGIIRSLQSANSGAGLPHISWQEQWTHRTLCKFPFSLTLSKEVALTITGQDFPRGSAIGEFIGLVTKGMDGTDVMQSGHNEMQYQIYQGTMGSSLLLL